LDYSSDLKMEATFPFETSVNFKAIHGVIAQNIELLRLPVTGYRYVPIEFAGTNMRHLSFRIATPPSPSVTLPPPQTTDPSSEKAGATLQSPLCLLRNWKQVSYRSVPVESRGLVFCSYEETSNIPYHHPSPLYSPKHQ
jgi:hypothetical protein